MKHPFSCENCQHRNGSQCSKHNLSLRNPRSEICPDHAISPTEEAALRKAFCHQCSYCLRLDEVLCMSVDKPILAAFPGHCSMYAAVRSHLDGHTQLTEASAPASASTATSTSSSAVSTYSSFAGATDKSSTAPRRTRAVQPATPRSAPPAKPSTQAAPTPQVTKPAAKQAPVTPAPQATPSKVQPTAIPRQPDRLQPDDSFLRRLNPALVISVLMLAIFAGMAIAARIYHNAPTEVAVFLLGFMPVYSPLCGLIYGISNLPGSGWFHKLTAVISALGTFMMSWELTIIALLTALLLSGLQGVLSLGMARLGTWIANKCFRH